MGGSLWGGSWRFDWIIRFEEGKLDYGLATFIVYCGVMLVMHYLGNGWMDGG